MKSKSKSKLLNRLRVRSPRANPRAKAPEPTKNESYQSQIFFSGDEYFQNIIDHISRARIEIIFESYIFDLDLVGFAVLDALAEARKRNIKVQLMVDGIGSFNWLPQLLKECEKRKIGFRAYHAIPFQLTLFKKLSWKNMRRFLFLFRRLNKRNHRKMIVIDKKTVFLGSYNISQVHSEKFFGENAWRDTGIRFDLTSPAQSEILHHAFRRAWSTARSSAAAGLVLARRSLLRMKQKQVRFSSLFHLNYKLRMRFRLARELKRKINSAKKRILITNPYFLPRSFLLRGLKKAARRGVFVGLCLPQKTDVWMVREASRSLYTPLLKEGVYIYEYVPRVLHAKTIVVDHWGLVGSHNLNYRSFLHDLEIEAYFDDPVLVERLVRQWDEDVQQCQVMTLKQIGQTSWPRRLLAQFIFWFRYWL